MSKYQLKLELLSDLCVSDGSVYNSSVDIDICHDSYGFPYIPAKRIRGCLRECAGELRDWGMDISEEKLFGGKGADINRAPIRIGDARIEGYNNIISYVRKHNGHNLFHPQNILSHYSYIRTQTSIDYDTGAADETTLRTIRVVNKGTVFCAEVLIEDSGHEKILEECLRYCCTVFHSMGLARTRGLGEVKATLEPIIRKDDYPTDSEKEPFSRNHSTYVEGSEIMFYNIELEEPVICKSLRGGESRTKDYIEGSKLLGLVIGAAKKQGKDFLSLMEHGELFCSNAYISDHGVRYKEVPSAYYSVKNDKAHYVNKLIAESVPPTEEPLQLNMMKHCYINLDEKGSLYKKSVEIEERYHHRRPMDKSIGRATEETGGDSQFYQMSAIKEGQTFSGYFMGDKDAIKNIYEILERDNEYYIGYSRSSEYGKVRLTITRMEPKSESIKKQTDNFYVKLEAPTIVYGDNAFYSTDVWDLIEEIIYGLKISKEDRQMIEDAFQQADASVLSESRVHETGKDTGISRYVRYTATGGFNVKWNRYKPVVTAFDKGTTLHFRLDNEISIHLPSRIGDSPVVLLGERISEGFGEASVHIIEGETGRNNMLDIVSESDIAQAYIIDISESPFAINICNDLFDRYLRFQAFIDARNDEPDVKMRPTVSNMIRMCHECSDINEIEESVKKRYSKATDNKAMKLEYAEKFISRAYERLPQNEEAGEKCIVRGYDNKKSKERDLIADFCNRYQIVGYRKTAEKTGLDLLRKQYLESYLTQAKYLIRQKVHTVQGGAG